MPKTASKPKQSSSKGKKGMGDKNPGSSLPPSTFLIVATIAGAVFGMSAPGFNYWYIAWVGLAPLLLLISSSPSIKDACLRSFLFGTAYNLVYLNWLLALHPLNWMGLADWQSIPLATLCWLIAGLHQGVIMCVFGAIMFLLPTTGTFWPTKVEEQWRLPALIIVPLVFTLLEEKIGNMHDLLGVPWAMIEYSQYRETALIQIASIIGGIGLGALIVMANVAVASAAATITRKISVKSLAAPSLLTAFTHIMAVALIITSCMIFGLSRINEAKLQPSETLSILQGNINIEMQKTAHRYTLPELLTHYGKLLKDCPPGICVWTESALPAYLRESPALLTSLQQIAKAKKLDMVIGAIDRQEKGQPFNSAFGLDSTGQLLPEAYHKRFLVPAGEYTPAFVRYLPSFIQKLTDTPAGTGFGAGVKPVVLDFSGKAIAPLICFETIAPELVVSSVRNGGQLLVNISDLAWFHDSMIGEQTTSFAVFRSIESNRYFVYAANTGPSLVINPLGFIEKQTKTSKEELITCKVSLLSELTPFTQWFH